MLIVITSSVSSQLHLLIKRLFINSTYMQTEGKERQRGGEYEILASSIWNSFPRSASSPTKSKLTNCLRCLKWSPAPVTSSFSPLNCEGGHTDSLSGH